MCKAYGLLVTTYRQRITCGQTLEEALTKAAGETWPATDHRGVEYPSAAEMCRVYNIPVVTYRNRRKAGWTKERALTTPVEEKEIVTDDKGIEYPSVAVMCRAYSISLSVYRQRMKSGMTQETALTKPVAESRSGKGVQDHLGNQYPTVKEMCKAYGMPLDNYISRRKSGWSEEDALTTPVGGRRGEKKAKDHLGREYNSEQEMCRAYGMRESVFRMRMRFGWSLEEALTKKG